VKALIKNQTQALAMRIKNNPDDLLGPIIFSIIFHLLIVIIFSISDWVSDTQVLVKPKELKYIKTVVVNKQGKIAPQDQTEAKKIEDDRIKEVRRKEQQEQQVIEEQKRIAAQKAKTEQEKKDLLAKQQAEKLAKEKAEKEKAEKDKAAKDKLTKDKLAKEKAAKEKLAKEKAAKDKAAKEKAEKEKLDNQQKKSTEEALLKQRQEREAQLKKMREARQAQEALAKKREDLEEQRQQAQAEQDAPVLDEYEGHIQNKVGQSWSRPLSARKGMQATLQINLLPGGDVDSVKVIKSSGNQAFDDSATQAVWKASPLPVPSDAGVFTRNYRVFNLLFSPEDLWQ